MSDTNDRSSRLIDPGTPAPTLSSAEIVAREAANGLRQTDRMFELIDHAVASQKFRLRTSNLIELNRLAVDGLVAHPGAYRTGAIEITDSAHVPPPPEDVAAHVDDLCDYVTANWEQAYPVHLAAFLLWRINWIHPFEDGNGRTSRAVSYMVLCIRLGYPLPGTPTIPEMIAQNKRPYYAALEAADAAWKEGRLDLSKMEELLTSGLAAQLVDVVEAATGSALGGTPEQPDSGLDESPEAQAPPSVKRAHAAIEAARKPRLFIGSSVEGLAPAEDLQLNLEYEAEVTLWTQGIFGLSQGTLESLMKALDSHDFAALVLTPDDLLTKRGEQKQAPRDNVLFELGLFVGRIGRNRTFIVHSRSVEMHIPSDLAGVTVATYDAARSDGNLQAALGPVATKMKRAIRDQGLR